MLRYTYDLWLDFLYYNLWPIYILIFACQLCRHFCKQHGKVAKNTYYSEFCWVTKFCGSRIGGFDPWRSGKGFYTVSFINTSRGPSVSSMTIIWFSGYQKNRGSLWPFPHYSRSLHYWYVLDAELNAILDIYGVVGTALSLITFLCGDCLEISNFYLVLFSA